MKYLNKLTNLLTKDSLAIEKYNSILKSSETFFDSVDLESELLVSNGYPIYFSNNSVSLKTTTTNIENQVFCVVDIETTASTPQKGQLLEIAAIKIKNGQVIEKYESLVNCFEIPYKVQELTGIDEKMVLRAPNLKDVLEEFKIFLEDDIFVAHNLSFDYKFLSDSFEKYNLGQICNRGLCTIDLSHKLIIAQRYGLKYLSEELGFSLDNHHRAMSDTMATVEILKECLKRLPRTVKTSEELIKFSSSKVKKLNS